MSHMFWSEEEGLHEASAEEMHIEADNLDARAKRAGRFRRKKLADRATNMRKDAKTADVKEDKVEQKFVIEHIEAEKNATVRNTAIYQAHRKWGPAWEKDRLKEVERRNAPAEDKPQLTWSDPDKLADGVDPDRLGG